jgi:hypothetical protein
MQVWIIKSMCVITGFTLPTTPGIICEEPARWWIHPNDCWWSTGQSYLNASSLMEGDGSGAINVVNIDIDGKVQSCSPFYQLLLYPRIRYNGGKFYEFAVQGNQCSLDHSEFSFKIMAGSSGYLEY